MQRLQQQRNGNRDNHRWRFSTVIIETWLHGKVWRECTRTNKLRETMWKIFTFRNVQFMWKHFNWCLNQFSSRMALFVCYTFLINLQVAKYSAELFLLSCPQSTWKLAPDYYISQKLAIMLQFYHSFWRRGYPGPPWRPLVPPGAPLVPPSAPMTHGMSSWVIVSHSGSLWVIFDSSGVNKSSVSTTVPPYPPTPNSIHP